MKRKSLLLLIFVFLFVSAKAQDVLGKWYSIDPDTGLNESIIELYEEDGRIYGKNSFFVKKRGSG